MKRILVACVLFAAAVAVSETPAAPESAQVQSPATLPGGSMKPVRRRDTERALEEAAQTGTLIDVVLAPDQPIPCVYLDEPLVIRWTCPVDAEVGGILSVFGGEKKLHETALDSMELKAGVEHWSVVNDLPGNKGRYRVALDLVVGGQSFSVSRWFCRIERPMGALDVPAGIRLNAVDPKVLFALQSIPIRNVIVKYSSDTFDAAVSALRDGGFSVSVVFEPASVANALQTLESLAQSHGAMVKNWFIGPNLGGITAGMAVDALRKAGTSAPVTLLSAKGPPLIQELQSSLPPISAVGMEWDAPLTGEIDALKDILELQGQEHIPLSVVSAENANSPETLGPRVVHQIVGNAMTGASSTYLSSQSIVHAGEPTEGFLYLTGMATSLNGMEAMGVMPAQEGVSANVFRKLGDWTIVLWRSGGEAKTTNVSVGDASNLKWADGAGNDLGAPVLDGGAIPIALGPEPVYVSGTGGFVLAAAALLRTRAEAKFLAGHETLKEKAPAELLDIFEGIAASKDGKLDRIRFFELLRALPYFERQWREGGLQTQEAVPVIAALGRLIRAQCVLEQAVGEPFLDTVAETLGRSQEYQNAYLREQDPKNEFRSRSAWLIEECKRLEGEALSLSASGRETEATAVASLAEWRARSLETAARANGNGSS
ncbi:MAG: hypothetical protein AMXMBFR84_21590 [Candidatus Hydrogenedentota bacterium]